MDAIKNNKAYLLHKYFPQKMIGKFSNKISYKIVIKRDYTRKDGTNSLYLQIFLNKEQKRIPLDIYVPLKFFDENKQRIKKSHPESGDLNLIIEKALADINEIEIAYRLDRRPLTVDLLMQEFQNPSMNIDFIKFYEQEIEVQRNYKIRESTYRQQKSTLRKIKRWKPVIYFHQIDDDFIKQMVGYFKRVEGNSHNTISTLTKNFKKYLGIANKAGIYSPIHYTEVPHRQMRGTFEFLDAADVKKIYQYYCSPFITESKKRVAGKFLFSCFTGLRISDIVSLSRDHIVNDDTLLIFEATKTEKIQQIKLNQTAKMLVTDGFIFENISEQKIREHLKEIVKTVGITKHVNYHMSRHTFATNFLMQGGRVEVLQKFLGHSSINDTMKYVHVVKEVMDTQIMFLDNIVKD